MAVTRKLSAEERALWARVVRTVHPLRIGDAGSEEAHFESPSGRPPGRPMRPIAPPTKDRGMGANTLDAGWDRRLAHGLVRPDAVIDLHGCSLAAAHALLDRRLEAAVKDGARLVLLITGKPPRSEHRPIVRGAIRAAVGDWLAGSRHSTAIAAIRAAHSRHGGAGALYLILRRIRRPD